MDFILLNIILFVVAGYVCGKYDAKIKGKKGERKMASMLSGLPRNEYRVHHDLLLKGNHGMTQIDHVVLSTHGIFVIETKNYTGLITGGEYSEFWTKNMYGAKYKFRNPLMQNYAHIKTLAEILCVSEDNFIPIVAFSSECDIDVYASTPVIHINHIRKFMKQYDDNRFLLHQLNTLDNILINSNITSIELRKEHIRQIKSKVSDNQAKLEQGICPRCGNMLVYRKGRNGSFIGCSSYPKCRYTNNI